MKHLTHCFGTLNIRQRYYLQSKVCSFEAMAADLTQQMWKDIRDCECFSLQLDESTDVSDTAQMCIFIRMVFSDITAKAELLTELPMKKQT